MHAHITQPERRRSPRTSTSDTHLIALDVTSTARLIDVSVGGVLVASRTQLMVGDRRELYVTLGTQKVTVPIEVRHTFVDRSGEIAQRAGAVILPTTLEQRHQLEELFCGKR